MWSFVDYLRIACLAVGGIAISSLFGDGWFNVAGAIAYGFLMGDLVGSNMAHSRELKSVSERLSRLEDQ